MRVYLTSLRAHRFQPEAEDNRVGHRPVQGGRDTATENDVIHLTTNSHESPPGVIHNDVTAINHNYAVRTHDADAETIRSLRLAGEKDSTPNQTPSSAGL